MLNLSEDAKLGLQKLRKDIGNLLIQNKKIKEEQQSSSFTGDGTPVFINNNYYQPQIPVQDVRKNRSYVDFVKLSVMLIFLCSCIAISYMLVIHPEGFIDKLEIISKSIIEVLRSLFCR